MDTNELMTANKQALLKAFHCASCDKLMKPPTTCVDNFGTICRDCFSKRREAEEETKTSANTYIDDILNTLKVPCEFRPAGCNLYGTYEELSGHQPLCDFRTVRCVVDLSSSCDWSGPLTTLKRHIVNNHKSSLIHTKNGKASFNVSLNFEVMLPVHQRVIAHSDVLYFVHFGSSEDRKSLSYGLHSFGLERKEQKVSVTMSGPKGEYKMYVGIEDDNGRYVDGGSTAKNHYLSLSSLQELVTGSGLNTPQFTVTLKWPAINQCLCQ